MVIAIIALLMAILVPVLSGARRQAQGAVCKSNLRQVGLAAHFYTERSDGLIPRGTSTVETTWFQLFMPYFSSSSNLSISIKECKIYFSWIITLSNHIYCFV